MGELMSELQIFNYNGNEVRTIQKDGEPWWVLKDVCEILGISHVKDTVNRLEEDEVGQTEVIDRLGRIQTTNIINEVGRFDLPHPQSKEKTLEMLCINELKGAG